MVTPDSYCYCLDQNNTCACLLKQMVGLSNHLILHVKLWKEWKYHVDMWFNLSRWNIKYGYMAVHRTQVLHFSCVCVIKQKRKGERQLQILGSITRLWKPQLVTSVTKFWFLPSTFTGKWPSYDHSLDILTPATTFEKNCNTNSTS